MCGRFSADGRASRVKSIVRSHSLLFDSPLFGLDLGVRAEYEALLDFDKKPDREKLRRVASVLRTHETLFAGGLIGRDEETAAEIPVLLRYLSSLSEHAPVVLKRSNILPKNLGAAFARKRLGVPLFGLHRPRAVPSRPGLLLCYQSIAAEGIARLSAFRPDGSTAIRYRGLGVEYGTSARIAHCVIAPSAAEPFLTPSAAFSRRPPAVFAFDRFTVFVAASKPKSSPRPVEMDPYAYQYAYYFFDDGFLKSCLSRFLRELLSGMFGIPPQDSEPIIALFIERSS